MPTVTSTTESIKTILLDETEDEFDNPDITAGSITVEYVNDDKVVVELNDGDDTFTVTFSWEGWAKFEQKIRTP